MTNPDNLGVAIVVPGLPEDVVIPTGSDTPWNWNWNWTTGSAPTDPGATPIVDGRLGVELDGADRKFSRRDLCASGHARNVDVDLDVDARRMVGDLELPAGL